MNTKQTRLLSSPEQFSQTRATSLCFGLAFVLITAVGDVGPAFAGPSEILVPGDRTYPESLTSTSDGTIIIGSLAEGTIFRVPPGGSKAEPWIEAGTNDSMSILGVLADEKSGTLWACSDNLGGFGVAPPRGEHPVALKSFDLSTGEPKGSFSLPTTPALCNDIAIGPDGAAYVTDSLNPTILRLKPGATEFEVWAKDDLFAVEGGVGLDGITFGSDGNVYTDTYHGHALLRVEVNEDGSSGAVTQLKPSQKLELPDGMRRVGDALVLVEGGGRLDRITVNGDAAEIEVLKEGLNVPVAVTQVGDTAWVLEAQLNSLLDPKAGPPSLPFKAYAVSLPSAK
jgi:sugar lactone lactonase YvrE